MTSAASGRPAPPAGLCSSCRHRRLVRNTRGSTFSLCRRATAEPVFERYPRLPVLVCHGHEEAVPTAVSAAIVGTDG